MKNELKPCPICKSELNHFEGSSSCDGYLERPYVNCRCGFFWQSKKERKFYRGENGWDEINRTIKNDNQEIIRLFGIQLPNKKEI